MLINLIGISNSGKGSLSWHLKRKYGFLHYSIGDILRKKSNDSDKIQEALKSGKFISDDILKNILLDIQISYQKNSKNSYYPGIIIDGFPRHESQIKMLDEMIKSLNVNPLIFYLKVNENTIINRAKNRLICVECNAIFNNISAKPLKIGFCDYCNGELIKRNDDEIDVLKIKIANHLPLMNQVVINLQKKYKIHIIEENNNINNIVEQCFKIIDENI